MDLAATGTVNTRSNGMARATSLGSTSLVALSPRPPPEQFFGVGKIWEDLWDIYDYIYIFYIWYIYIPTESKTQNFVGWKQITGFSCVIPKNLVIKKTNLVISHILGPDGPGFADIRIMISRNKMRFHDLSESNLEDGLWMSSNYWRCSFEVLTHCPGEPHRKTFILTYCGQHQRDLSARNRESIGRILAIFDRFADLDFAN
jgi:hypothetical protein